MNITEIRLNVGRTVNAGNFESVRLDVGLSVSVPDGADVAAIRAEAHEDLRHMLKEAWRHHKPRTGEGEG